MPDSCNNQALNALMVNFVVVEDPSWYANTRASHHVTNNMQNLSHKKGYNDKKSLIVANGSKLGNSHIGNAKLQDLSLNNVLYVPKITKNLVSVSQLVTDNKVNIIFNSFDCFGKNKWTSLVMFKGKGSLKMVCTRLKLHLPQIILKILELFLFFKFVKPFKSRCMT